MAVIAKFKVDRISDYSPKPEPGHVETRTVFLSAVYSDDPANPNHSWSKWTPSGQVTINITNPDAFNQFVAGDEYFVTFDKVVESEK